MALGFGQPVMEGDVVLGVDYRHLDHDLDQAERRFHSAGDKMARDFDGHSRKIGRSAGVMGSGISRGAVAGVAGLVALAGAGKAAFGELAESEKVSAVTASRIKSTGAAAHVTAKQVDTLADSLLKKTGVDDEQIKAGENMLLTFTKIRNETGRGNKVFDEATKITLDLSRSMGVDMSKSAVQVGKALNDPIKGIGSLSRVGVAFTAQQKEQIKALVDSGHTMDAQKIILKELKTEFGGTAEAMGKTFGGQANLAKEQLRNLGAEAVKGLLPAMTTSLGWINEHGIPALREFGGWVQDKIVPAVKEFGGEMIDRLRPAAEQTIGFFRDNWPAIHKVIDGTVALVRDHLLPIIGQILEIGRTVVGKLVEVFRQHQPQLERIWERLKTVIGAIEVVIRQVLLPVFKFVFSEVMPRYLGALISIVDKVSGAIEDIVKAIRTVYNKGSDIIADIRGLFDGLKKTATGVATGVLNFFRDTWDGFNEIGLKAAAAVLEPFSHLPGRAGAWARKGKRAIETQLEQINMDKAQRNLDTEFEKMNPTVRKAANKAGSTWLDAFLKGAFPDLAALTGGGVGGDSPLKPTTKGGLDAWDLAAERASAIADRVARTGQGAKEILGAAPAGAAPAYSPVGPVGPVGKGGGKGGPKQGWASLDRALWDEFMLYRAMMPGQEDLGTYNPDSPGDHAVYPAKAFDAGFKPETGWANPSARRFFMAMVNRPGIKYAILGGNIWSASHEVPGKPGSGIHPYIHHGSYNSSDHADHVHVSGYKRGGLVPGRSDRDGTLAWLSGGEAVLTGSGQAMLEARAPGLLDRVLGAQLPHFRAGGRYPAWTKVGGTMFGGPADRGTGHIGYKGDDLRGTDSYAELSLSTGPNRPSSNDYSALGGLPYLYPLQVRVPGSSKVAVVKKRDVGYGQGGASVGGHHAAIDLWYEVANRIGFTSGYGELEIADVGAGGTTPADPTKPKDKAVDPHSNEYAGDPTALAAVERARARAKAKAKAKKRAVSPGTAAHGPPAKPPIDPGGPMPKSPGVGGLRGSPGWTKRRAKAEAAARQKEAEASLLKAGLAIPYAMRQRAQAAVDTPGVDDNIASLQEQIVYVMKVRARRKWTKASLALIDASLRALTEALDGLLNAPADDTETDDTGTVVGGGDGAFPGANIGGSSGGDSGGSSGGDGQHTDGHGGEYDDKGVWQPYDDDQLARQRQEADAITQGVVDQARETWLGAQSTFWQDLAPNVYSADGKGGLKLGSSPLGAATGPVGFFARPGGGMDYLGENPPPGWKWSRTRWLDYRHAVMTGKAGLNDWRGWGDTGPAAPAARAPAQPDDTGPSIVNMYFNQHPDDPAVWMQRARMARR